MNTIKGYFGKTLIIDIKRKKSTIETIPDALFRNYLGGKGLSTYYLLKNNPPGIDPLSDDNHLILSTGPLAGTPIWGGCGTGCIRNPLKPDFTLNPIPVAQ